MTKSIQSFRDLMVYRDAVALQKIIFDISRPWPKAETYALTDQIRRSSRSIGANIAEAWGKRRYPAHFLSKLTDADAENLETQHWIDTAFACGYIDKELLEKLSTHSANIGRMLGAMMAKHESFCIR